MTMPIDPTQPPLTAYEQHVQKWLAAHARGARRFEAVAAGTELELAMLDIIGVDWWTGEGITSKWVKQQLDANPNVSVIRVLLDSPGGSVFDGVAIHNLLKRCKARVEIEVIGEASSAASVIAMCGDIIRMHEGATMMVHRASSCACGFAEDFRTVADALDTITGSIMDIYETRTGRRRTDIEAMVKKETWMSAGVAVEEGFADEIIKAGAQPAQTARSKPKAIAEETHTLHLDFDTSELDATADKLKAAADALLAVQASAPVASSIGAPPPQPTPAPTNAPTTITAPEAHQEEDMTMSEITTIRALLGLGAGTPETDVTAAVSRLRDLEREVVTLTGAKSTEEAVGAVRALKAKADESDVLKPELEKIRGERDRQNFNTLIAQGQTVPMKLSPAVAKLYREEFEAAVASGSGSAVVERLRGFLSVAPVIISQSVVQPRASHGSIDGEAPALVWNGKSYEQLTFLAKAQLKTENVELFNLMKEDWQRRGKPSAKAA